MTTTNASQNAMAQAAHGGQLYELDPDLRAFLDEVRSGQSLYLAAWAARVLRAGRISMKDLEKTLGLGFLG